MNVFIEQLLTTYVEEYINRISNDYDIDKKELEKLFFDNRNKGFGAGGKNTTLRGKKFEDLTDNEPNLTDFKKNIINNSKCGYYLEKSYPDKDIIYVSQSGLRTYMKKFYKSDLYRNPDEAYIIKYKDGKCVVKILEKKNQNVDGSVETKLYACESLRRDYELMLGKKFKIEYALCVSSFLQEKFESNTKKYNNLKKILNEKDINIFYGEEDGYFFELNKWINS